MDGRRTPQANWTVRSLKNANWNSAQNFLNQVTQKIYQVIKPVDQIIEPSESNGQFLFQFPWHGDQNFLSRIWLFHYFFFHDMVLPRNIFLELHKSIENHQGLQWSLYPFLLVDF